MGVSDISCPKATSAEVTGGCEPPDLCAGNQAPVLCQGLFTIEPSLQTLVTGFGEGWCLLVSPGHQPPTLECRHWRPALGVALTFCLPSVYVYKGSYLYFQVKLFKLNVGNIFNSYTSTQRMRIRIALVHPP